MAERVRRTAELVDHDRQAIVWCGLNPEAYAVAASVNGSVNVEGSWEPERKSEAIEAFQVGDIRVLVTKPSICGFGLNFQNANQQVFCGLGDSYEMYYQSIRRSWRFGQNRRVDVHIVVSDIEQQIVQNVKRKEKEASEMSRRLVEAMNSREVAA